MYYVVTGAAGFIGSNIVKALNARGVTEIIAVDNLSHADKFINLVDCDIADYIDKTDFLQLMHKNAEFEADRMGLILAARAGYDAYGLPAVLEEIGHVAPGDSRVALLFKTHPAPDVRFSMLSEDVGDRLDNLPPGKELADRFHRVK